MTGEWGVAVTKPGQHRIAVPHLERQGFSVFNPCYEEQRLVRNRTKTVCLQLFVGYVFVNIGEHDHWPKINNTYGISRLITRWPDEGEYMVPAIVPSGFVEQLTVCSRHLPADPPAIHRLAANTRVAILSGAFQGHRALLLSYTPSDRVRLLMDVLGRDGVQVELLAADIAALAA